MKWNGTARVGAGMGFAAGIAGVCAFNGYIGKHKHVSAAADIELLGADYFNAAQETVVEGETIAIEIDAPADVVWAHIKQMGQDRAGLYSFERLERAFTIDIHNHYTIHPEWQNRQVGDFLTIYQPPLNLGFEVFAIDEQRRQMFVASDSREQPSSADRTFITLPTLSNPHL